MLQVQGDASLPSIEGEKGQTFLVDVCVADRPVALPVTPQRLNLDNVCSHISKHLGCVGALYELTEIRNSLEPEIRVFEPIKRSTAFDKSAAEARPTLKFLPNTPGVQNYYQLADDIIAYG